MMEIYGEIMKQYGRALGRLHSLSEEYEVDETWNVEYRTFETVLDEIKSIFVESKMSKVILAECNRIRDELKQIERTKENYGLIHFDFETDNVLWDEESQSCNVIDFEDQMYHFYACDVAVALDSIREEFGEEEYATRKSVFLKGYGEEREGTNDMLVILPLMQQFVILQKLASNIRTLSGWPTFGKKWNGQVKNVPEWMIDCIHKLQAKNQSYIEIITKNYCANVTGDLTGRIVSVMKNMYKIRFESIEITAVLRGSFYKEDREFPVVGDYVKFQYNPYGDSRIEEVCERKSVLKRADQSGHAISYVKTMKEQVMVANLDYVFVLTSLNDNYSVNRIARYVSIILQGNSTPVVILTKTDLCENVQRYIDEVKALSEKAVVHAISSITGEGMSQIQSYIQPGVTIGLLGSSGVGKSTLVNALAGETVMKAGSIRESDSKGRHTTTSREMIFLENGCVLIDTPGMRELGMCGVEEGIDDTFMDI